MFSEVFIPEGLQVRFLEVRILKELAAKEKIAHSLRLTAYSRHSKAAIVFGRLALGNSS
jgi:hypothetical protein